MDLLTYLAGLVEGILLGLPFWWAVREFVVPRVVHHLATSGDPRLVGLLARFGRGRGGA